MREGDNKSGNLVEPEKTRQLEEVSKVPAQVLRLMILVIVKSGCSCFLLDTFEPGSALWKSQTGDAVGHPHEYSESNQVTLVYYSVLSALPDSTIDA